MTGRCASCGVLRVPHHHHRRPTPHLFLVSSLTASSPRSYLTYTEYVLKNPFYELEMPIRLEQFDAHLLKLIQGAMGHNIHGAQERREK